MYVLGSTPEWAATNVKPDVYYYGGGTASEPKKLNYWRDWVRDVATRYKGRITSYQIWNEANLASFWAPERPEHWKRMALLTDIAAEEIREIDPKAKVVSASSTVIQGKKFATESFFYRYLRSVAKRKVKLDAVTVHLYPWTTKGPGGGTPTERLKGLEMARSVMADVGLSKVPIWDTEVNYGNRRDNGHPEEAFGAKVGSAYLARTYVDSLRYGVTKVFWYAWESQVMGISTTRAVSGDILAPGPGVLHRAGLVGRRQVGRLLGPARHRLLAEARRRAAVRPVRTVGQDPDGEAAPGPVRRPPGVHPRR